MFSKKKPKLYCITLSTYKEYITRFENCVLAWENLYIKIKNIIKKLREWANSRNYFFITELYIVLPKNKNGKYYPHIHGCLAVSCSEIIERLSYYWRKEKLGKGEFTTKNNREIGRGNIYLSYPNIEKSYGTKNDIQYGIMGFLKYAKEQEDKIYICKGEEKLKFTKKGTYCCKSLIQDNYPKEIKDKDIFLNKGCYNWNKIFNLWVGENNNKNSLSEFFFKAYQKKTEKEIKETIFIEKEKAIEASGAYQENINNIFGSHEKLSLEYFIALLIIQSHIEMVSVD